MVRGAALGLVFDTFSAQLTATFLVEHQMPRGVVRVPVNMGDADFVENYLLAMPDEQLFDASFHIKRARESVDTSLPLVIKAYQVLCCTADANRAAKPITGQSDTTVTTFTDITATTFLGLFRMMAMLHGYANAWHFAWFMLAGVRDLDVSLAFLGLFEMLPKLAYGTTVRQRFADNKLVKQPLLTEPCKRCHQPGHLVHFCGTASDKAYDKVPSHYVCRLCGERHQIYNCPKYVSKTVKK
jgi:hypothetical protein